MLYFEKSVLKSELFWLDLDFTLGQMQAKVMLLSNLTPLMAHQACAYHRSFRKANIISPDYNLNSKLARFYPLRSISAELCPVHVRRNIKEM